MLEAIFESAIELDIERGLLERNERFHRRYLLALRTTLDAASAISGSNDNLQPSLSNGTQPPRSPALPELPTNIPAFPDDLPSSSQNLDSQSAAQSANNPAMDPWLEQNPGLVDEFMALEGFEEFQAFQPRFPNGNSSNSNNNEIADISEFNWDIYLDNESFNAMLHMENGTDAATSSWKTKHDGEKALRPKS